MPSTPAEQTTSTVLRQKFNSANLYEKACSGQLTQKVVKEKHPSPPPALEPTCTRSQFVHYSDEAGVVVARVHQYLRQDGTLGASGLPDPKVLLWEGKLLYAP
jgi:hypothetical protein